MAIDPDLIEQVKKHADIVKVISSYQSLERKGKDYLGLCPFHDDSSPRCMSIRRRESSNVLPVGRVAMRLIMSN